MREQSSLRLFEPDLSINTIPSQQFYFLFYVTSFDVFNVNQKLSEYISIPVLRCLLREIGETINYKLSGQKGISFQVEAGLSKCNLGFLSI